MKAENNKEILFLNALEELIETFSNNPIPINTQVTVEQNPLNTLIKLMNLETSATNVNHFYGSPKNYKLDSKFKTFMQQVETTTFHLDIIPYDKITECVFLKTPPEILSSFTVELRARGNRYFDSLDKEDAGNYEKQFLKIMRHIDLALVQKNSFVNIQIKEMDTLKRDYTELNKMYTSLKSEADKQYQNMLTQFISILGIFAAILMGSFGAIQGFSNLFANADKLQLGELLIISSIGASSVLLILFFLLNGIAKLTGRSLSSSQEKDVTILKKHPTIVLSHGILISVILIGTALLLSNVSINLAWQGLWWLLPIFWGIYFVSSVYKNDPFYFKKYIPKARSPKE